MSVLVAFFTALAAAFVAFNIAQTAAAYGTLPAQVPTGLNADGSARGFAPRPMIWFPVIIQLVVACVIAYVDYAIATHQPGTHGTLLGSSIAAVCIMGLIWRVQALLIESARNGGKPVSMRGFWMFFGVWLAVLLFDAFAIH
jgi:hypothetical protein